MLRPSVNIKIQQTAPFTYKNENGVYITVKRDALLELDFAHSVEIESGWSNHTDTAKVVLPKNIILKTDKALFSQRGVYNVILGGADGNNVDETGNKNENPPLLMRGDVIYIQYFYIFKNQAGSDVQVGATPFSGYISKVHTDTPITIECEDNFYLLKRTPCPASFWKEDLISLCKKMIDSCNSLFSGDSKYNDSNGFSYYPELSVFGKPDSLTANFSLGYLDIGTLSCSEVLNRLRSQYHMESFFVENELHFGFPIYDEDKANDKNIFEFQNNIFPDNSLTYSNKSDVQLSAVVSCRFIEKTGKKTKDGSDATKNSRESILIYWDINTETFKYLLKKKNEPFPTNEGGERHEFLYSIDPAKGKPNTQTLVDFGIEQLKKYFYTGYRGSFTTFGFPFVRWGDNINLLDKVFSDRNGRYKVKKVTYRIGIDGISQEIEIDYKLPVVPSGDFVTIYMI